MQINVLHNRQVLAEQARAMHQQAMSSHIGSLTIPLALLVVFWQLVPTSYLLAWYGCQTLVSICRFMVAYKCGKNFTDDDVVIRWLYQVFILLALSGLIWGVGTYLFLMPASEGAESLLIIIYIVLMTGSLSPLAPVLPCYLVYVIPAALPLGLQLFFSETMYSPVVMSLGFLTFLGICCLYARNIQANTLRMIALRFENTELLARVTKSQKLAIAQADIAEKATISKSKFLAATTHDLAQPLNSLVLFLAAQKKTDDKTEAAELIAKAHQCADNLKALFKVLQEFSQLDAEIPVSTERFDIADLINPIAVEFELKASNLNRGFEVDVHSFGIETDGVLLQRIIRNLLENALKHNRSGKIGVRTIKRVDQIVVEVFDTGQGIANDQLNRIFEEYVQLNARRQEKSDGLGLGLPIVAKIAKLLNIEVDVRSTVGQGTVFSITLPIVKNCVGDGLGLNNEEKVFTSLAGQLVVVIDDDEVIRDAMRAVMKDWGCEVMSVVDGGQLIEILSDQAIAPSIIVSDYHLANGKNGFGEITLVREEFNEAIPAIIVTGDNLSLGELSSFDKNIPVLSKPIDEQELHQVVAELLSM